MRKAEADVASKRAAAELIGVAIGRNPARLRPRRSVLVAQKGREATMTNTCQGTMTDTCQGRPAVPGQTRGSKGLERTRGTARG